MILLMVCCEHLAAEMVSEEAVCLATGEAPAGGLV